MSTKFLLYLIVTLLALCQKAFCQQKQAGSIHESIKIETDHIFDKLVDFRRDLHENPVLEYENIFSVNDNTQK